jgi:hypothetical protein
VRLHSRRIVDPFGLSRYRSKNGASVVAPSRVTHVWLTLAATIAWSEACGGGGASATGGGVGSGGTGWTWTCAERRADFADPLPPALEFVIDVTRSMAEDAYPDDPNSNVTKLAELGRILSPVLASLPRDWAVGIELLGYTEGSGCYQGRQAVPINPLTSSQLDAINTAVAAVTTQDYRPTAAARRYALQELTAYSDPAYANSDRSIVLITDGAPTVTNDGCTSMSPLTADEYDAWINQVRTEGPAAGVKTYVIGIPGSDDPQGATFDPLHVLSVLAVAGGTAAPGCTPVSGVPSGSTVNPRGTYCHLDLTASPDFASGLTEALHQIARQVAGCTYRLPPATSSDWECGEVSYTLSDHVLRSLGWATHGACTDCQWHVSASDGNGVPSELELSATACDAVKSDPGATVSVTFGCPCLMPL